MRRGKDGDHGRHQTCHSNGARERADAPMRVAIRTAGQMRKIRAATRLLRKKPENFDNAGFDDSPWCCGTNFGNMLKK